MSKKKLTFYDAFRQKPDEASEQTSENTSTDSSTSSKSTSGFVAYTPGEELTIRPRPKHIPTSHHLVGGQNIEVRAKGSTLPPGMAQKYQTPNVNRTYLPSDSSSSGANRPIPSINVVKEIPPNNPPMPKDEPPTSYEELQPFDSVKVAPTKAQPTVAKPPSYHAVPIENVKPISSQSATMPYLDVEDLETQNIKIASSKKIAPTQPNIQQIQNTTQDGTLSVPIPVAFVVLFLCMGLMVFSYFLGSSFRSENNSAIIEKIPEKILKDPILELDSNIRNNKKMDQPIVLPEPKPIPKPIENIKKGIIIRACTVESMERAKALAQKLEESGIKPTELKQTTRGVLLSVGPFETSTEANNMLKSFKFMSIKGWKPFADAYIVNNK